MNFNYDTSSRNGRRVIQIEAGSAKVVLGFPKIAQGRVAEVLRDLAEQIEEEEEGGGND